MASIRGLFGLRPHPDHAEQVSAPPYDVIKPGSPLRERLFSRDRSIVHVTLGDAPAEALASLRDAGALVEDPEPAHYVYEQTWDQGSESQRRLGVFTGVAVTDYSEQHVIRHEKTFEAKVKGRIALCEATEHVLGPVFLLTAADIMPLLEEQTEGPPLYDFVSDFGGGTDLHGVRHRIWRWSAESGDPLAERLANHPLYIADGHHRYHAALRGGLSHTPAYITNDATIQAYNRVIRGPRSFADAKAELPLRPADAFETPAKHEFSIYTQDGTYRLAAQTVPEDVVGRLDCAILERELYPALGLEHRHVVMEEHFDYYPESALDEMKKVVDDGSYEIAVALHPVSTAELMAVADAGLDDSDVVMPEKSTFFSPKILTGLVLQSATKRD